MRIFLLFSVCIVLFPVHVIHAQELNAGFVQGLWYSTQHIFAGKPVRIYVAVRNYTGSDLSGSVTFLDSTKTIDKKTIESLDGRIVETWADWDPTYGTHTISANLSRVELSKIGSTTQNVTITSGLAQDTFFVDYDTDGDGIGNQTDTDDDADSISDTQEQKNGTDPLIKNVIVEEKSLPLDTALTKSTEKTLETNNKQIQPSTNSDSTKPEGLEHFLTDSPAENVLSSVTNLINQTKQNVDAYRAERTVQESNIVSPEPAVNANGFGEITRTTSTDKNKTKPSKIDGIGFFGNVISVISTTLHKVYGGILFVLSFILGHPMFVQLGILLLILFLLMKFAARFGRRPKKFR